MHIWREHQISAIMASTGVTMSIGKVHIMTRHHNDEWTCKIALELGWFLKKGLMMPFEACSIVTVKQLVFNKHMDDSKKATKAGKRIFSDLATIKASWDSGITITNKNWHIIVDQHTGYNELECYCNMSDFVKPTCKKFNEWKILGNWWCTLDMIMHQRTKF